MAGKSVAYAKIIEHIQNQKRSTVAFFFCGHYQSSSKQVNNIFRNIAAQLLCASTSMAPYILETFASNGLRATSKSLQIIVENLIESLTSVRLVVDGVDESDPSDQKEILGDLMKIKSSSSSSCKILFSTRRQPTISKYLHTKPTVRMENYAENVTSMISSFVHGRLGDLRQKFGGGVVDGLEHQIIQRADGQ